MTTDPAVTAAAEAMWGHIWPNGYTDEPYSREEDDRAFLLADAEIAVAAARPIIEAEVLARIAVKHYRVGPARCACGYDAYKVGGFFPDYHAMLMAHLDAAGRIARGTA